MLVGVEYRAKARPLTGMAQAQPKSEREALRVGKTLRRLRQSVGMTQEQAAAKANMKQQTWQQYEAGNVQSILRKDVQTRLASAVGASYEDLQLEMDKYDRPHLMVQPQALSTFKRDDDPYLLPIMGHVQTGAAGLHVAEGDSASEEMSLREMFGPHWRLAPVADQLMSPYVDAGGFVSFNVRRPPHHGAACVVQYKGGTLAVRRFDGISGDRLFVSVLHPKEMQEEYDMKQVEGLYAIGLRLG